MAGAASCEGQVLNAVRLSGYWIRRGTLCISLLDGQCLSLIIFTEYIWSQKDTCGDFGIPLVQIIATCSERCDNSIFFGHISKFQDRRLNFVEVIECFITGGRFLTKKCQV